MCLVSGKDTGLVALESAELFAQPGDAAAAQDGVQDVSCSLMGTAAPLGLGTPSHHK